jgi:hypothetical protein
MLRPEMQSDTAASPADLDLFGPGFQADPPAVYQRAPA